MLIYMCLDASLLLSSLSISPLPFDDDLNLNTIAYALFSFAINQKLFMYFVLIVNIDPALFIIPRIEN